MSNNNIVLHPRFVERVLQQLRGDVAANHEFRKQASRLFWSSIVLGLGIMLAGVAVGWLLIQDHYADVLYPFETQAYQRLATLLAIAATGFGIAILGLLLTSYAATRTQRFIAEGLMGLGGLIGGMALTMVLI